MSVNLPDEIQRNSCCHQAKKANDEKRKRVHIGHRGKEDSVAGAQDENQQRMIVNEGWTDIGANGACGKQQRRKSNE